MKKQGTVLQNRVADLEAAVTQLEVLCKEKCDAMAAIMTNEKKKVDLDRAELQKEINLAKAETAVGSQLKAQVSTVFTVVQDFLCIVYYMYVLICFSRAIQKSS